MPLSLMALLVAPANAAADVSAPLPGVTLVTRPGAAMTVANLCAPGVSVRATRYAERQATPGGWAQSIGAQVAINADFFDFPGWSYVLVRARGDGEEWPPEAELLLQPSSYWQFGGGLAGFQPSSVVPPDPWVTQVVGAYDLLIAGGQPHVFGPDEPFMLELHRRSAIGLSADGGTLYFYASNAAIDGPGMAAEMISMAAEAGAPPIDIATNEDGGGSSQLYVQGFGQIIDSGRQVNTHLGLYASGAGGAPNCPTTRARAAAGGVAAWDGGRVDLMIQGDDDVLHHLAWDGTGWSSWEALASSVASSPVIASWGAGRLDAFAVAPGGTLGHTWFDGGWGDDDLGGELDSAPVVTSWGGGRLDAFALRADHTLDHWAWGGLVWSSDNLGGQLAHPPAVTAWSANRLDLFAVDTAGTMNHKAWSGLAWGDWEPLGGAAASPPSVVSWGPYRLDAFALASDHTVSHWSWQGGWGQDSLGGALASPPAVASWGPGRLDVFGVDADGQLQHAYFAAAWSAWEALGGALDPTIAPTVIARQPGILDIFAVGSDRAVWHLAWNGVAWTEWESLGGQVKSPPADGAGAGGGVVEGGQATGGGLVGGFSSSGAFGAIGFWLVLALALALRVARRSR